ncbi:MAG TPA: LysR family transcriptional regulator [Solirubrobacteraceae bacterium]|nr:LysR family transcriptional regulator [Solirubrobacteraceae bacterium]
MLDSRRMRVLLQVARTGSLAAAAAELGYTPSAVSQQIRALERELGTVVLERRGRGVVLTGPGQALAEHAQRIVDELRAAEAEVEAIAGLRAGTVRLGWFSTAGAILIPRAIARFRERHPDIELELEEADPDQCAQALREGQLDLAVVYEFRLGPRLPADLRLTPLIEDRLHIALPPGHRLARRKRIRMAELRDETWIQGVRHGSTLATLPAACREAGFEPRIALRTDDPMAWQGLVAAGVGVAVIPELTLPTARSDILVRELDAPSLIRKVSVAMPLARYSPPAATAMVLTLKEVAAELAVELTRARIS